MTSLRIQLTVLLLLVHALAVPTVSSWSGNRAMVEQSVQKLDQLNRKLLKQEAHLPRSGQLKLKADVRYRAGGKVDMQVYSRKFQTVTEKPIRFNGKQAPMPSK